LIGPSLQRADAAGIATRIHHNSPREAIVRASRAAAVIGVILAALTTGAARADAHTANFAQQARQAGLTTTEAASLQRRVDTYLARTGGTQVAFNKIDLDGKADLVLALPGARSARDISRSASYPWSVCESDWLCAFSQEDYQGDILRYYYCAYKLSMPFAGFGSYVNIQTPGTSAHFYDSNGSYMYDSLAAPYAPTPFNWTPVYWIKPCGAI